MKSTVEPLEGNKVKLSVEVDEAEFEKDVDAAFKRIAREVRVPGFRPGKVPRRILEARVGTEAARAEALQHSLPEYYTKAVTENEVDVIAPPEIDITTGEESGPIVFDAVVEVRPQVVIGGYANLRVTLDSPVPTDEEVDARIERLREQFSTLNVVERPAAEGDSVTIDISGSQDGEPLSGMTADGYLYEVGAGNIVPELDTELTGASAGDTLEFSADHPNPDEDPVDFSVTVQEVKEKLLPELDDEFANEASEFETIAELRSSTTKQLATVKSMQGQMALQEKTAEALAELVTEDIPEPMVEQEMQNRIQDMAMRLQAQGMELGQWLQATGTDQETFVAELRTAGLQAVKVDLALRAVAEAESIEVSDDELEEEFAEVAERVGQTAEQVRTQFERNEQVPLVRSDAKKRKALDWLLEQVEVVDQDGNTIDRALLKFDNEADPAEVVAGDEEAGDEEE